MINSVDYSTFKQPTIGNVQLEPIVADQKLHHFNHCGVSVSTDSTHLAEVSNLIPNQETSVPLGYSLLYFTGKVLMLNDQPLIAQQTKEFGGEIYIDEDLRNFTFGGVDSYGTLSHMTYGIRSFAQLSKGKLGLHSAVIFDHKNNGSHLLIGATGAGKSTLGRELQSQYPDQYTIIGDDWAEIDTKQSNVSSVSQILSYRQGDETQDPLFTSFKGKQYFLPNSKNILLENKRVLSATEIHTTEGLGSERFLRTALYFIPFLTTDDYSKIISPRLYSGSSQKRIIDNIREFVTSYKNQYQSIMQVVGLPKVINDRTRDVLTVAKQIHNQFSQL